jgi:glucose-1-phosphate thymidylyltransferase
MVLAGGFAKRMWPLTMDFPKSLLPVAGKPVIDHIIEKTDKIGGLNEIYVSTNKKFEGVFRKWIRDYESRKQSRKKIILIVEPVLKEEEKFGSIKAIEYFIKQHKVNDDVLIIGGDNIFSFSLKDFLDFSREKKAPAVAFFDMGDTEKVRRRFGVCVLDGNARIKEFQEKPDKPKSALVSTCIYHFPKSSLKMISEYLKDKNNPDAPGYFITWLLKKTPVYGFVSKEKWYDIGSQETYKQADRELRKSK